MKTLRLVALLGLTGACAGGCAAAGLATGPLMSAIQVVADRAVERTVPAELGLVWSALEGVLSRNAIRIDRRAQDGDAWRLDGTGENVTVHARLTRVTPRMTRLTLRVETGSLLADRSTSEQLQGQIALAFASSADHGDPGAPVGTIAVLEEEVRRLRSTIETRSALTSAASRRAIDAGGALAIDPGGVVTIPPSYGFATIPRPVAAVTPLSSPMSGVAPDVVPAVVETAPLTPPGAAGSSALAERLRPAGVLKAAPSVTGDGRD